MPTNKSFLDPYYHFEQELYQNAQKQNYLSIKRKGSLIRAVFWNHTFFEGVHKTRTNYKKSDKGEKETSSLNRAHTSCEDIATIFHLISPNIRQMTPPSLS